MAEFLKRLTPYVGALEYCEKQLGKIRKGIVKEVHTNNAKLDAIGNVNNHVKAFNPKVSIVIPVYNGSNYLSEAIDSALAQTYKNLEIIVSNDGSNDNGATEKIAKSYGDKIIYLSKKENGGAATALNLAIKNMTGSYFSWLSHDDMYYSNKIERQVEELGKLRDKNTIMMSDLDAINEKYEKIYETKFIDRINEYPPRASSNLYPIVYNQTHGCTLLIPKVCFEKVGLFGVKEIVAQDFEFFYRAFLEFPHKLISEVLVTARDSSNRMGRRAKPRASVEYSRLYISIIENLSDEDIKLLSPDKLSFFYDMYDFFRFAGYEPAREYITKKMSDYISIYLHDLFHKLMKNKVDLDTIRQLLPSLRLCLGIWNGTETDIIDNIDLILKEILIDLSVKDLNDYFLNNHSRNTSIYNLLSSSGYKRASAYFIKNMIDCSIKNAKVGLAVNTIYDKLVGRDIDIEENDIDNIIYKMQNKSNKPRLLFCSTHWLTGGMERVMSNLFNQLKTQYELYLITPFDGKVGLVPLPDYVTHIKISSNFFYSHFDETIFSYAVLLDIDVAIGLFNLFGGVLDFYKLCKGTKIKTISSNQEYYFYPYKNIYLTDIASKRLSAFQDVDAVLWPTNFNAAVYGLRGDNVFLVTDPNTFEIQKDAITKKDKKIILCVGRFNDYTKRIDRILNCFKMTLSEEPEAKLMLVGPCNRNAIIKPGDTITINDLIARLDIDEKSMIFVGEVNNVKKYYAQASLLLLASNNEGFGMVINEAACYGVPSVCNNIPGIEDLVVNGENGYIVEQDDIEDMANHVCKILSDDKLREKLGENAKKIVKKFDAKTVGDTWKFLINTLLAGKSKEETRIELNKQLSYKISDNKEFSKILFNELNNIFEKSIEAKDINNSDADYGNYKSVYASHSWRITRPARLIKDGALYLMRFGLLPTMKKVLKKVYVKTRSIVK